MPFIRAIDTDGAAKFSCEFVGDRAIHTAAVKGMRLTMQSGVMSGRNCEVRRFTVENQAGASSSAAGLLCILSLVLTKKSALRRIRCIQSCFWSTNLTERTVARFSAGVTALPVQLRRGLSRTALPLKEHAKGCCQHQEEYFHSAKGTYLHSEGAIQTLAALLSGILSLRRAAKGSLRS